MTCRRPRAVWTAGKRYGGHRARPALGPVPLDRPGAR
ncbi:hypothetical protein Tmar_1846 [Thermaerobacter marianensis DSM 12885]|uniref:Uncharacterized protein n=1 Tax=Thermaerobacter marianensis (strain ATCC 700841 / DSM 12885 / JCM 10246 / 7p75a) TaxID=644966 RepID=E6SID6_THEM7|nr:hypothetical protein Tmar_1846 [Thermaerobacter marianensis DSM 12885]